MNAVQWLKIALMGSIMLTVFGLGLSSTFRDATFLLLRPKLLAKAFLSMNIIMPVVVALIALAFALPFAVKVALMGLAVSPVPPIIQKKQLAAGGRLNYVVGLLLAMSVLAVAFVPLAVTIANHVFDRQGVLAPWAVAKIMLTSVLAPLLVGLVVRRLVPAAQKIARAIVGGAFILLLAAIIPVLIKLWPQLWPLLGNGSLLVMVAMAGIGLAVGHVLGGPRAEDRTALAISTASRHPAVALAVATSGSDVEIRPALAIILLYVLVAMVVCLPYQKWRAHVESAPESAQ
jgi:bile acid:Na+ symporter, BASS family